jgi:hypothetical protein
VYGFYSTLRHFPLFTTIFSNLSMHFYDANEVGSKLRLIIENLPFFSHKLRIMRVKTNCEFCFLALELRTFKFNNETFTFIPALHRKRHFISYKNLFNRHLNFHHYHLPTHPFIHSFIHTYMRNIFFRL